MAGAVRHVFGRIRWIVFAGVAVAIARFVFDCTHQKDAAVLRLGDMQWTAEWISVYYAMPLFLLIGALRGAFRDLGWRRCVLAALMLGLLNWSAVNIPVYTAAQFLEWNFGRFYGGPPDDAATTEVGAGGPAESVAAAEKSDRTPRSAPLGKTAAEKLGNGVLVGTLTGIAGFVWCFVWIHLLVYLPRRLFGARV